MCVVMSDTSVVSVWVETRRDSEGRIVSDCTYGLTGECVESCQSICVPIMVSLPFAVSSAERDMSDTMGT